ncbi:hypothetical protein CSA56_10105 [candidate division KSB3 bacterium]|uniref:Polymerase/histidinol phosphatase N-terminal domain-containing protein n=1 Tax=candidate division KSB3 bacterium TaxID=2044937 RepID=A0A2G6KDU0_9BACT|nr:MAG: hypothetical protein CSA56_10105 [candidate division KSB3 bacterium]
MPETRRIGQSFCSPLNPEDGYIDLHLHTNHSDGQFSPKQLVEKAIQHQLRAIAVTDHDTVSGIQEARYWAQHDSLQFLEGVEMSTYTEEDGELHILGYAIDPESSALREALDYQKTVRRRRIQQMLVRLQDVRITIPFKAVQRLAGPNVPIGRPHLARALVQAGAATSVDKAFDRFLAKGRLAWVPKVGLTHQQAIQAILEAGGIPVYAHPGIEGKDELIPKLQQLGLRGLEVFHSKHSPEDVARYAAIVTQRNLLATGGSDCHGGGSKDKPLIGSVHVPYRLFTALLR